MRGIVKSIITGLLAIMFCFTMASAEEYKNLQFKDLDNVVVDTVIVPKDVPNFFEDPYVCEFQGMLVEYIGMVNCTTETERWSFTLIDWFGDIYIDVIYDAQEGQFYLRNMETDLFEKVSMDEVQAYGVAKDKEFRSRIGL
jgi:hypothetical protein